jgi:hypothetical protein
MQFSGCIKRVIISISHIYDPNMDKENPHKYYNDKNNMPINVIGRFSLMFFKDIYPYI